jgi:predicted ribosome quality control (RQC) complex YloA/Tae2 family protein
MIKIPMRTIFHHRPPRTYKLHHRSWLAEGIALFTRNAHDVRFPSSKEEKSMKPKSKISSDIKTRLDRFDEIIAGLKQRIKEEKHADSRTEQRLDALTRKREEMQGKLETLQQSDESSWDRLKSELDEFMNGVDDEDRRSWSLYK